MRKLVLYLIITSLFIQVKAQDGTIKQIQAESNKEVKSIDSNGWKKSGIFILNLSQGALSNWVAGGEENTLGFNGLFNYSHQS